MINAACEGMLPVSEPYDLFGALSQQCLSVIASDKGRFTRVADLCNLVAHKPYLNRDLIEIILAELSANNLLQPHGYKNRYGAYENLYRLVDLKMIYGNFGIGSQMVDVFHGAKQLGEVPAINLIRVRNGACVRFAGRCWWVKKSSRYGISLQPVKPNSSALDFLYGGKGIHPDPFLVDRMWQLIHSSEFPDYLLVKALRQRVSNFRKSIQDVCSINQIPYKRSAAGIRYFTFGGYLVNKAIGLVSRKPVFDANDISLTVPSPIDWSMIPANPLEYQEIYHLLFEQSSEQSIYQQNLPIDLQQREYLQPWLKDNSIQHILARLVLSKPKLIESGKVPGLQ